MELKDLQIYGLAREISKNAWSVYNVLPWNVKKIMGDQFITAIDSISANIAEGWGRFHFLDRNRFNYHARGSLLESVNWLELLFERDFVSANEYFGVHNKLDTLRLRLNNYINATKKQAGRIAH